MSRFNCYILVARLLKYIVIYCSLCVFGFSQSFDFGAYFGLNFGYCLKKWCILNYACVVELDGKYGRLRPRILKGIGERGREVG